MSCFYTCFVVATQKSCYIIALVCIKAIIAMKGIETMGNDFEEVVGGLESYFEEELRRVEGEIRDDLADEVEKLKSKMKEVDSISVKHFSLWQLTLSLVVTSKTEKEFFDALDLVLRFFLERLVELAKEDKNFDNLCKIVALLIRVFEKERDVYKISEA